MTKKKTDLFDVVGQIEKKFKINPQIKQEITSVKVIKKKFDPYVLKNPPRKRQEECFEALKRKESISAILPTAYGKTNIALEACELQRWLGKKFIVLAPLKALVTEHTDEKWSNYFNTLPISGDDAENKKKFADPTIDGFVMTFEMYYQFLLTPAKRNMLLKNVGVVIFDEAHLICDKSRGHRIESAIYVTKYHFPKMQFVFLSATIGNAMEYATHFNTTPVIADSSERPVPLKKEFFPIPKIYGAEKRVELEKKMTKSIIQRFIAEGFSKDNFPNFLFFVTSREDVDKIVTFINFDDDINQFVSARGHHAGMYKKERNAVEKAYRNKEINVVVCTTTLSMGMDMPCDICVLLSMTFYDGKKGEEFLMDGNQIIQIMGRAGRGQGNLKDKNGNLYGLSILIYNNTFDTDVKRVANHPLVVCSQIPNHLDYILLSWYVADIPHDEILQFYTQCFNVNIDLERVQKVIEWLHKARFLDEDHEPTAFGKKTVYYGLEPKTALHFIQLKRVLEQLNSEDITNPELFALLMMTPEFCDGIVVRPRSESDQLALSNASKFISSSILAKLINDNEYFAELIQMNFDELCKAFGMIYEDNLVQYYKLPAFKVYSNDKLSLKQSSQRIVQAGNVILGNRWKFGKRIDLLNKGIQCEPSIFVPEMLSLLQIEGLGYNKLTKLMKVGITNLSDLQNADTKVVLEQLKQILSKDKDGKNKIVGISESTFMKWKMQAADLIAENIQYEDQIDGLLNTTDIEEPQDLTPLFIDKNNEEFDEKDIADM